MRLKFYKKVGTLFAIYIVIADLITALVISSYFLGDFYDYREQ